MFFFFVGGVNQEVRQVLQSRVGRCLSCGSEASLVTYDNVLKLFFVPVWRWPGKDSAIYCDKCGFLMHKGLFREGRVPPYPTPEESRDSLAGELRCWSCARLLEREFNFCPFCGSAQ